MSKRTLRDWMGRAFFARDKASFAQLCDQAEQDEANHAEPDGDEGKHASNVHVHIEHKSEKAGDDESKGNGNGGNGNGNGNGANNDTGDRSLTDRVAKLEDGVKGINDKLSRVLDALPPEFLAQQKKAKNGDGDDDGDEGTKDNEGGKMPAELREHFESKDEDVGSKPEGDTEQDATLEGPGPADAELMEAEPALQRERMRMGDAAYKSLRVQAMGAVMRDTVARAEVLSPGIKVGTLDAGIDAWPETHKRLCNLRRAALIKAAQTEDGKQAISMDADQVRRMSCDAVKLVFNDASARMRAMNNTRSVPSPMFGDQAAQMRTYRGEQQEKIAAINRANREYWAKQGVGKVA